MPWASVERPSPALSALAAFVHRELPDVRVAVRSEYVELAQRIQVPYEPIAEFCYEIGEALYASLLYEGRDETVADAFAAWARGRGSAQLQELSDEQLLRALHDLRQELRAHARAVAHEVAPDSDVVGLSCAFGQVFASILVARYVKEARPECLVVLGGSSVSAAVGPSLLAEYAAVDCVVQGEGERALIAILNARSTGEPVSHPNVLDRRVATSPSQWWSPTIGLALNPW